MRAKILSASAGSGKTYRLAYKFVHDTIKHYNEKPYLYRAILAVTFTNKATEEMKSRIIREFNRLTTEPDGSDYMVELKRDLQLSEEEIIKRAKSILTKILHDYSRFTILTIDKFFQRILRAFIKELGIDLNYNIELESSTILARSADALIDDIVHNEELQSWIMAFAQENMDDNESWDIRKKILGLGSELFKERSKQSINQAISKEELTQIIRQLEKRVVIDCSKIEQLGEETLSIMQSEDLEPSDFSGASKSFTSIFVKCANGEFPEPNKTHRERAASTDKWVKSEKKPSSKNLSAQAAAIRLQPILKEILEVYDKGYKAYNTLALIKRTYRSYALLQDIYEKVGHICNEEGVMLLSETKYILSQFIDNNDAPFIYEKTGNRFERFMIDEFQDTSAKEWANFVPLLQNAMSQSEDNSVLIVGDVKQSIYRWRGGDWRILQQGVGESLGKADTELEILANNYRSLPRIVEFNNMAIGLMVELCNTKLNDRLQEALYSNNISQENYDELYDTICSAYNGHAQNAKKSSGREGYVRVEQYEEQPPLIECIESVIGRGYSYGDIMILHRSANDVAKSAHILLEYKQQNNAFNIMTQDSLVIGKAPISNFIISLMRLSQNADDTVSRALVNSYMKRPYDAELCEEEAETLSAISQLSPEQAFEKIVAHYGLHSNTEEIAYLQALHEQIITYCSSKVADIQLFLKYWDETGAGKALVVEESDSTIELTTIHKSKGLEKKIVIIPYCNWTLDPKSSSFGGSSQMNIVWATTSDNKAEVAKIGSFPVTFKKDMMQSVYSDDYYREVVYSHVDNINILYVALTRACEELYVYIPVSTRNTNGVGTILWNALSGQQEEESQFIEFGSADNLLQDSENKLNSNKEDNSHEAEKKSLLIDEYPTTDYEIKLSLPLQRYFDEPTDSTASLEVGIMMHKILSEVSNEQQIKTKIKEATDAGTINELQAESLKQTIDREFQNPQVREWFGGEWDMVRCENDIIRCNKPGANDNPIGTLRPDRVMIKGDKVVIVDYKFGNITAKSHIKQMREYLSLMKQMGYTTTEGYIWYLSRSEIVTVNE